MWRVCEGMVAGLLLGLLVVNPPAGAQSKTINLSMLAGFKEDVLRANLPEFEKKTGIKVVVDSSPIADLYQKQLLSLSTRGRHDVFFMDEPSVPALAEFLLPLDERAKGIDSADFIPTTVEAGSYQGKLYALPVDPNVQLLMYRKDLFEQKGLKPPTTWEELLQDAKAFYDPAKQQYGFSLTGGTDTQTPLYLILLMWSYGAEVVDNQGNPGVNTPAGRKGAEMFLELLKVAPPNVKNYNFADVNKSLQLGQAAMAIQWASGAKPLEDPTRSSVVGKLGFAVPPKGTRTTPMRGVWTIAIAKNSPNQEAAWEFAKWLSGREFGLFSTKFPSALSAIHSPRFSVLKDPSTKSALPYVDALLASLEVAKGRSRLKEYPDIGEHMRLTTARLTAGELTLDAALKEMDAGIKKILGK
ncbi:MAG TPA: sugar ABC transporter substrate-binding protein [Candidatus Acidoferrum sp.]|nr:sugar ABC transporter substrate-binding protein [Candidatus Acidoferrum sp.]